MEMIAPDQQGRTIRITDPENNEVKLPLDNDPLQGGATIKGKSRLMAERLPRKKPLNVIRKDLTRNIPDDFNTLII